MARPSNAEKTLETLREIRERYNRAVEADRNRDCAIEDLKFVYEDGAQWQQDVLRKRAGKPNFTYNRVLAAVNQVIGDQRQNKPSIKVRGVDSNADPKTAEVLTGLIRNIENSSDADTAYDTAFKSAVASGLGVWRVVTEYESDDSFDQEICIKRVSNPFTVYFDPSAKDFEKRDAQWCIITERLAKDTFEQMYPKADPHDVSFDDYDTAWLSNDEVRVAEYFRRKPAEKTIARLSDGRTVEYDKGFKAVEDELAALGITVEKLRTVQSHVIEWMKVSGSEILEGPIEYKWKYIPIVPVYGRCVDIEGEEVYQGLVRHSKDPQRSYNVLRSTMVERIGMTPMAPYMVTATMIKDYEDMWANANVQNMPFLLYEVDPQSPTMKPAREPAPDVPVAYMAAAEHDIDDIKATTGFHDASLGRQSNETSGKAIIARDRQGDVGSYEFIDNLSKAIKFTGEILVDMIPQVYDSARQIRILGIDGKEEFVPINQEVMDEQTGEMVLLHDLTQGKYDVAVTVGPSYTTQRQESADMLIQLAGAAPLVAEAAADLIVKNLDLPGADELEKRLRGIMIRQGVVKPTEEDADIVDQPSESQQMAEQVQMQMMVKELEKLQAEVAKIQADTQSTTAAAAESQIDAAVKVATFITTPPAPAEGKTSVNVS